jgi:serine/threonine protein kinase
LALTPGTRLGVYEVTTPIGEGGMGQGYRARDTKLNRDVALKVLPDSFANDAARFAREAQILASLNHPHGAPLAGLGLTAWLTRSGVARRSSRRGRAVTLTSGLPV